MKRARVASHRPSPRAHLRYGGHVDELEGVEGVHNVKPNLLRQVYGIVTTLARKKSLAVITGESGAGKSFAVARAVERLLNRPGNLVEVVWLDYSSWARGVGLLREIHDQIIGDGRAKHLSARELRDDLRIALSEGKRLLVVDEAQWVSSESLIMLTKLRCESGTNFSLLIIGTPVLLARLAPEVVSRTYMQLEVDLLSKREVWPVLTAYHDVFATATQKKLQDTNNTVAGGEMRFWAQFLAMWWELRDEPSVGYKLTDDVIDVVVGALKGR